MGRKTLTLTQSRVYLQIKRNPDPFRILPVGYIRSSKFFHNMEDVTAGFRQRKRELCCGGGMTWPGSINLWGFEAEAPMFMSKFPSDIGNASFNADEEVLADILTNLDNTVFKIEVRDLDLTAASEMSAPPSGAEKWIATLSKISKSLTVCKKATSLQPDTLLSNANVGNIIGKKLFDVEKGDLTFHFFDDKKLLNDPTGFFKERKEKAMKAKALAENLQKRWKSGGLLDEERQELEKWKTDPAGSALQTVDGYYNITANINDVAEGANALVEMTSMTAAKRGEEPPKEHAIGSKDKQLSHDSGLDSSKSLSASSR